MKKTILYVAIATMFAACGNGAKNYTLTGKVDTLYNGSYAHLSYGEVNDSVQVVDGSFVFEGRIDTPVLARVMVTKEKERAGGMVVLEAGVPEISLVGDEVICGGSPLNDAYNTYNKKMEEVYNVYRDAYMALRGNKELSDEERDAEMEKRGEEFSAGRRALNTELFAANTNNALGAVALLQLARDNEQFDSLYNAAGEIVRAGMKIRLDAAFMKILHEHVVGRTAEALVGLTGPPLVALRAPPKKGKHDHGREYGNDDGLVVHRDVALGNPNQVEIVRAFEPRTCVSKNATKLSGRARRNAALRRCRRRRPGSRRAPSS